MRSAPAAVALLALSLLSAPAVAGGLAPSEIPPKAFGGGYQAYALWDPVVCPGSLRAQTRAELRNNQGKVLPQIVAAFLPQILDAGYDWVTSAIETAAAEKTWSTSTTLGDYFYRLHPRPTEPDKPRQPGRLEVGSHCFALLILKEDEKARGNWKSALGALVANDDQKALDELLDSVARNRAIGPVAYFEFGIDLAEPPEAFRVSPSFAWVFESMGKLRDKERKDFAVTYQFSTPKGDSVAAGLAVFPYLQLGKALGPQDLETEQAAWLPALTLSEASKKLLTEPCSGGIDRCPLVPFNLKLTLVETKNANEWLRRVAAVLKKSKQQALASAGK
jgi:hypothetical protein